MYYYNFIMGWSLFFLATISFVGFVYFFGIKEPGGWKGLCALLLVFFFAILGSHFLRLNLIAHVSEEIRLGRQVEVCGGFLRMDGGYILRGRETPNVFAVFLIGKQKFVFDELSYNTKDVVISLKKDEPVCIQYVKGPFPQRDAIIVKVSRGEKD